MSSQRILIPIALAALAALAGCSEKLENTAGCPILCPQETGQIKDTVIDAIAVDTSVGAFPGIGMESEMLLANRPGIADVRGIIRFDTLPTKFTPTRSDTARVITEVDSAYLLLHLDTTNIKTGTDSTITFSVFDVDTAASDTVVADYLPMFDANHLLGSATVNRDSLKDTLQIFINDSILLARLTAGQHLRVGVQAMTQGTQVRITNTRSLLPSKIVFRPGTDTTFSKTVIFPSTRVPPGLTGLFRMYQLIVFAPPPASGDILEVGGLPARRVYIQFQIPKSLFDSTTIVRASLLLTQRPTTSPDATDSMFVVPLMGQAQPRVTNYAQRAALVATEGNFGLDSLFLLPSNSGVISFNVVTAVRAFASLDTTSTVPYLVLRAGKESGLLTTLQFYSLEAPADLRPRLRISYVPRVDFGLP